MGIRFGLVPFGSGGPVGQSQTEDQLTHANRTSNLLVFAQVHYNASIPKLCNNKLHVRDNPCTNQGNFKWQLMDEI